MSAKKLEVTVVTAAQAANIARARTYYAGIKTSADQMGVYGFLFGTTLAVLKDSEHGDHGRWMKFCAANFNGIPHRTITWFMDAAAKLAAHCQFATVDIKLLEDGSLPKPVEDKVLAAWHDVADGKTVTQFLRNSGSIREPKRPGSNSTGRKPNLSLDDPEAGAEFADELRTDMLFVADEENRTLPELDTPALLKFAEAHKALGYRIAAILKRRKTKA